MPDGHHPGTLQVTDMDDQFGTHNVQQLNAVLRQSLITLAGRASLLPGAEEVVFVDLDSTHRQVYGYAKQGAAVGRLTGKKTLHR